MSDLNSALMLSILAQMTQDNSVTGNQHVQDDINRLTQYVQTGVDPGGSGSPSFDPAKAEELLNAVQSNLNTIFSGLSSVSADDLSQQVQTLLDSVKAVQQYVQTGQTVDTSTAQTETNAAVNNTPFATDPANPLARHQQNFPSKG